ncbi:hypothetical protein GGI1_10876 [Acidithiobacillus sp. GGI-221]|nr:hypothetical protein GGI1_10876 [Acidithiobacillus sp. GGI-221]
MPQGYMAALGKLYGKQPVAGTETASERTQSTGVLPMPRSPKEAVMTKPKTQPKNPRALDINCKPEDMADGTARALLDPAATAALAMEMIYSKGAACP